MSCSDHDLMHRCQTGDAAAFAELVHRWQGPIARTIGRLSVARSDVDDLCQEVFLRVLRARDRYRQVGAFSTWIYGIALNVARDNLRRSRRQPQPLDSPPLAAGPTPAEYVGRHELVGEVDNALRSLPEHLREVLVLKHFGKLTFAQVAEITGSPVSTVKSQVQAALERLRIELRKRGIDREDVSE